MSAAAAAFAAFERAASGAPDAAWQRLLDTLGTLDEAEWLEIAQRFVLRGRADLSLALLEAGHAALPQADELALALAGLRRRSGDSAGAEGLLRDVLLRDAGHVAAALALADLLREQARCAAAAQTVRACFATRRQSVEWLIRALELLDDCARSADAAALAEAEIAAGCSDARIHAYAATHLIQLGDFERARERYRFAYAHDALAPEWDVPFGLAAAQRLRSRDEPDFKLLEACRARTDLSPRARCTLAFALGKACDDIGARAEAAAHWRTANEIARGLWPWSRKNWRRSVDARLQAPVRVPPGAARVETSGETLPDFVPVFVLGVPRSGTTLVAERLARHAGVCSRGETPWLARAAADLARLPKPDAAQIAALAADYVRRARQDDAGTARWFVDKEPLNFLHVGTALTLFPQARIVWCERGARDTALSLWAQFFRNPEYGFAYDFGDIAAVQQGAAKLKLHWSKRAPDAIRSVRYETLVADADAEIAALAAWLGLTPAQTAVPASSIGTASVWQARQPVYTRSVGRWRDYLTLLPELADFPER